VSFYTLNLKSNAKVLNYEHKSEKSKLNNIKKVSQKLFLETFNETTPVF